MSVLGDVLEYDDSFLTGGCPAYRNLRDFLRGRSVPRESKSYDVIEMRDRCKYAIAMDDWPTFFFHLDACRRQACPLTFMENGGGDEARGLFFDFDYKPTTIITKFDDAFFRGVFNCVAMILGRIVAPDAGLDTLFDKADIPSEIYHIFITRRRKITSDGRGSLKDGLHVYVPDIWARRELRRHINALVKTHLPKYISLSAPDLVDQQSAHVSPYLFGSRKPGSVPYDLVAAARVEQRGTPIIQPLDVANLLAGMSAAPVDGGIPINLPYELSLTHSRGVMQAQSTWLRKREVTCPELERRAPSSVASGGDGEVQTPEQQLAQVCAENPAAGFAKQIIGLLPQRYADEYELWFRVLGALAQSAETREQLDDFHLVAQVFSMRSAKYDQAAFERQWHTVVDRRDGVHAFYTMRSLEYIARTENPQAYQSVIQGNAREILRNELLTKSATVTHYNAARTALAYVRDQYIWDQTSEKWYEFVTRDIQKHGEPAGELFKWRITDFPHRLCSHVLPEVIHNICRELLQQFKDRERSAGSDEQRTFFKACIKSLSRSMIQLQSNGFQKGVIEALSHHIAQRGLAARLDVDPYVIGVENGVLEFLNPANPNDREFAPRLIRGMHEYNISRHTNARYVTPDPAIVGEILGAYRDIFPEPDMCDWMLMYLSTWLDACPPQRILLLLGGGGSNGKTWSVFFPQSMLGAYATVLKMQLLTEERERGNEANSALMRLKGLRGGYFDEANEGERLNLARVKTIVTPGDQTGRDLYSSEEVFRKMANLVAISNFDFIINSSDNGSWDRLRFYTCKTRFVAAPNPDKPEERKRREELTHVWPTDPVHLDALLHILVEYRRRLQFEFGGDMHRVPCPTLDRETRDFRIKQDLITRFISEMIVRTPGATAPLELELVIEAFHLWRARITKGLPRPTSMLTQFQNSRLGGQIHPVEGGRYVVDGIRVREHGDKLHPGEVPFV